MDRREEGAPATPPPPAAAVPPLVHHPPSSGCRADEVPEEIAVVKPVVSKSSRSYEEPCDDGDGDRPTTADPTAPAPVAAAPRGPAPPPPPVSAALVHPVPCLRNKNFAEKLHALLSSPLHGAVLRWNAKGDAFVLRDVDAFLSTVMPTYFQRSKFDSFARRMRRWGFRRTESAEEKVRGLVVFRCRTFRRDRPELCRAMCDDRQLKKRGGAGGGDRAPSERGAIHARGRDAHRGHRDAVPVHFPNGHGDRERYSSGSRRDRGADGGRPESSRSPAVAEAPPSRAAPGHHRRPYPAADAAGHHRHDHPYHWYPPQHHHPPPPYPAYPPSVPYYHAYYASSSSAAQAPQAAPHPPRDRADRGTAPDPGPRDYHEVHRARQTTAVPSEGYSYARDPASSYPYGDDRGPAYRDHTAYYKN